jgi:adenylate cyclase class 2
MASDDSRDARTRIEVEQKFPVADLAEVETRLLALGASISVPRRESDLYFAHPCRDFAATDEALRLRCSDRGRWITYKGPKIDATTKTRREIDLALPAEADVQGDWVTLLETLGFRPIAEVVKRRRKAIVAWQGRQIEASLDEVDRVGTFIELEIVTSADDLDAARACVASLAEHLRLSGSERRSYLELLLQRRGG